MWKHETNSSLNVLASFYPVCVCIYVYIYIYIYIYIKNISCTFFLYAFKITSILIIFDYRSREVWF